MKELQILKYGRKYINTKDVRTNKKYKILRKRTINPNIFPIHTSIIFTENEIKLKTDGGTYLFFETEEDLNFLNKLYNTSCLYNEERNQKRVFKRNTMLLRALEKHCQTKQIDYSESSIVRRFYLHQETFNFIPFSYDENEILSDLVFYLEGSKRKVENLDVIKKMSILRVENSEEEIITFKEKTNSHFKQRLFIERVIKCLKITKVKYSKYSVEYVLNLCEIIEELLDSVEDLHPLYKNDKNIIDNIRSILS